MIESVEQIAVRREATSIRPPLAVDLDGTLIQSDTLHETVITLLKGAPLAILPLAQRLKSGKAAVKRAVAQDTEFDPALLPYNQDLLDYLRAQHASGRRLGLFTAADQSIADAVAAHLGIFDVVRGSDGITNLSGSAKADAIQDAFGAEFVYAGDSSADIPIFARAAGSILVGRDIRKLTGAVAIEAQFPLPAPGPAEWLRALRVQHWSKNSLVFVAPFLAFQHAAMLSSVLLFILMGVLASATYLVNDLADLAADRAHPKKRFRPFAAGTIPVRDGVLTAAIMIVASLAISLVLLPFGCTLVLLCYLVITLLYSFILKRIAMIDVTVLAGLFTLRVLAGSTLVATPISPWLLTFSMLFFLGLAAIKRYAELHRVVTTLGQGASARGYSQQDIPILLATGVSTGMSAIVIFMIYLINEQFPQASYRHPNALWCIMPVLLVWTLRLWHLAVHGRMSEDPVVFALKDRLSLALGAVIILIMAIARL
jgi:4-hydroxybenzoate polyprenyltransferase/phosphoserine phosphatase